MDDEKLISTILDQTKNVDDKIPNYIITNLLNDKNKNKEDESENEEGIKDEDKNEENEEDKDNTLEKDKVKENEIINENFDPDFNMTNNLFEAMRSNIQLQVIDARPAYSKKIELKNM